jgi:hypothetical protein
MSDDMDTWWGGMKEGRILDQNRKFLSRLNVNTAQWMIRKTGKWLYSNIYKPIF